MPFHPNSAATRFKKGRQPANMKYEGHERLTKDGYVEISVKQTNKHTGFERSYVLKHRYLWEQKHGSLAKDMCLKCLDGNRQNCDPSNWKPIPRGARPFLNGYRGHHYESMPNDLKPTVLALAELKYARTAKQIGGAA